MNAESTAPDVRMDAATLYREEVFTDRKVGTIRRLTPVKSDGTGDDGRPVVYVGQAQLMTPMGALPLSFEIPAGSLDEAVEGYAQAAQQATEQAMEELKELRREAASSIVVPESGTGGLGGAGGPGGLPGGGKIQMP